MLPTRILYSLEFSLLVLGLSGCAPQPPTPSPGHLNSQQLVDTTNRDIPPPIQQLPPLLPPPQPIKPLATYTIVVDGVPADKLLFTLAREANLNIDIHPDIKGYIALNAIEQTLPQILERISKQIEIAYTLDLQQGYLSIFPDKPLMKTYKVNYVNMTRESSGDVSIATQISTTGTTNIGAANASGAGGSDSNNSKTSVRNTSNNRFWETLQKNIQSILSSYRGNGSSADTANNVIINPESGIVTVWATRRQQAEIEKFLDAVLESAQRQVLIEATIVEVRLNNDYQAGIDWQRIDGDFTYSQQLLGANIATAPFYLFEYKNSSSKFGDLSAKVRLLEKFGTTKVLSSPKLMALNNQTAVLKVVDNLVYFSIDVERTEATQNSVSRTVYSTEINSVPIGLIMNVTPQIDGSGQVTLNVRPTISRLLGYKPDPNPDLALANVTNNIPEIQVREMESILKVNDGDIAIIGGLMQDETALDKQGLPVLSRTPVVGDAFAYRDNSFTKTELVIFLRPVVIKNASLNTDLKEYRAYLPDPTRPDGTESTGLVK